MIILLPELVGRMIIFFHPNNRDQQLWNNDYYEINLVNENQDIVGKVPEYNYNGAYLDDFGTSFSIIVSAHYVSPESLGLTQSR